MKRLLLFLAIFALTSALCFAAGQTESTSASSIQLNKPGTYPIVNSPVTVNAVTIYSAIENNGDLKDAAFTKYFEKLTNVHINWVDIIESTNAQQKINLLLASGDLPDTIMTPWNISAQQDYQYGRQGVFQELTDLIAQRMPNLTQQLGQWPEFKKQLVMPNGKIYALPKVEAGCFHCEMSQKFWLYTPWLQKLGLKSPTTTDELYNVLKAFKTQDPNGNGKADEIPLMGAITGWNGLPTTYLMNSFIYTDPGNYLKNDNGQVSFVANTQQWRDGLSYMHKLYAEGLIAPETYTQKVDQAKATVENPGVNLVGSFPAGWYGVFTVNGGGTGRYADFNPIAPLKGPTGLQQTTFTPPAIGYDVVITNKATGQIPAVIAQMDDWFYGGYVNQSMAWDWSRLGVNFREATAQDKANGVVSRDGHPAEYIPTNTITYGEGKITDGWARASITWQPIALGGMPLDWKNDRSKQEYWLMHWTKDLYQPYMGKYYMPPNLIVDPSAQKELTDDQNAIVGTPGQPNSGLVNEYVAKFVTGVLDISSDSAWQAYLNELKKAGVDRYVQIMQQTMKNAGY
jgi:putative aldouronate transport system substrate-binding protein